MVVYQRRVSTDQVAGFTSSMKKGIGRSVMAKPLTDIFERSRTPSSSTTQCRVRSEGGGDITWTRHTLPHSPRWQDQRSVG